jgi:hypothetical protein
MIMYVLLVAILEKPLIMLGSSVNRAVVLEINFRKQTRSKGIGGALLSNKQMQSGSRFALLAVMAHV